MYKLEVTREDLITAMEGLYPIYCRNLSESQAPVDPNSEMLK
jgi:hypothetical protein